MFRPVVVALAAAGVLLASWAAVSQPWAAPPPQPRPVIRMSPSLRLGIVPAPADSRADWLLQRGGGSVLFSDTGLALHLASGEQSSREVGWRVVGARAVTPRAERQQPGTFHRMVGPPEVWETDLPVYSGLRYPGVLPGVDLWFSEQPEGLEYGFRAERGKALRQVRMEYAGARALRVVEEGRVLEADLEGGTLREEGLKCWQEALDGSPRTVGCRFAEARETGRGRWEYAIVVDVEDPERPVVVDPFVRWSSFLGDSWKDELRDMAYDPSTGNVYVVGALGREPVLSASSRSDVLIASYDSEGNLLWASGLGGLDGDEYATTIALGPPGKLYLAGTTSSPSWTRPLPDGGPGSRVNGGSDGFVMRITEPTPPSKEPTIDWLLHVGGSQTEQFNDLLVLDRALVAVGATTSTDMPNLMLTPGSVPGKREAFLARIKLPSLSYGTVLLRGSEEEVAHAVGIVAPYIIFAGSTTSFPDGGTGTGQDVFITSILDVDNPAGMGTLYLGGPGDDEARVLVRGAQSSVTQGMLLVGTTASNAFAGDAGVLGANDIFTMTVTVSNDIPARPVISNPRLIKGPGLQQVFTALIDNRSNLYVGGATNDVFVTPDAFDKDLEAGGTDGLLLSVKPTSGDVPTWASLVGGVGEDTVRGLQINPYGRLFVAGTTTSPEGMPGDAGTPLSNWDGGSNVFLMAVETDVTAPLDVDAVVVDGLEGFYPDGGELQAQTDATSLSATWGGFQDDESGISHYVYFIRNQATKSEVQGRGRTGPDESQATASNLNLQRGQTYEFVVQAVNRAGLSSEADSDGVYILPGTQDGGTTEPDGGTTEPDGGTTEPDGGTTEPDGGTTEPDGGRPGDGGVDAGTDGGADAGADAGVKPTPGPRSPMGYSCGCTSFQGSGGVMLGALLGLALLASRRRTQRTIWMCGMPSSSYTSPSARKPKDS